MKSPLPTERKVVLYLQVHQPRRLNNLNFFDIGASGSYFHDELNEQIIRRVAHQCYLPSNNLLLKLIQKFPQIRIVFSISGVAIDQFEEFAPEVLESFRKLVATGSVEFLGETYYHSLACEMEGDEFEAQIVKHAEKIMEHFHVRPTVFRNTELIYNDTIGRRIHMMGFEGVITEGAGKALGNRPPNYLYEHPDQIGFKILPRNFRLSDDIAFRYIDFKLTPEKFIGWLRTIPQDDTLITLGIDYETLGEHHKPETGIHNFMENLLTLLAKQKDIRMITAGEAVKTVPVKGPLPVKDTISWADEARDLSAWLGNDMQRDAFYTVTRMEQSVKGMSDQTILKQWRYLLTSDHFYYMATKTSGDANVHAYFSPYPSPYEAFINFMNVVADFSIHAKAAQESSLEKASAQGEHERQKQNEIVPTWALNIDQDHHSTNRH